MCAAHSFLEVSLEIDARATQGRSQAEQEARQQRDGKSEDQHRRIKPDLLDARDIRQRQAFESLQAPECQQQSGAGARQGQQETLNQELSDNPERACPQTAADGDLAAARVGASQQQIGNVGARDQQHQSHGT